MVSMGSFQSLFTLVEGNAGWQRRLLDGGRAGGRVAAAPVKSWEMKRRRLIALQEVHIMVSKCTQLSGLPVRK